MAGDSASNRGDGKYLFFMSTRTPDHKAVSKPYSAAELNRIHNNPENGNSDIYWMDAGIIEKLRPAGF
jgi:hypothetical protein